MDKARARRLGVIAGVGMAHALLFVVLSRATPDAVVTPDAPIFVELVRPAPPPPPPPPAPPAPKAGGGAPAAPSRIHTPPPPKVVVPPELPAPPVQAPEPELVVGVAPVATPTPGPGQGGQGTGTGTGVGSGDGPGSGSLPPRLIRGPSREQIVRAYPRAAMAARRSGRVGLRCRIRLDGRLEACRVQDETTPGFGFAEAALRVAEAEFRFTPPSEGGRPVGGREITVGVTFETGGGLRR